MRQRYTHNLLKTTQIQRDEDWVNHNWYRFLLWMLRIGGAAVLLWLVYGGFKLGRWTAPRLTTPAATASVATPIVAPSPAPRAAKPRPAAPTQPTVQPATPQQIQISGSLDLVHHNQKTQTTAPTAIQPTPQNRDEAWAQHLERDP